MVPGEAVISLPYKGARGPRLTKVIPLRPERALDCNLTEVNVHKHTVDLAFVITDFKFQGRGARTR